MDFGKLGVLPLIANIQGSGVLDGNGNLSGDFSTPSTLEGNVNLKLSRVTLEQQMLYGFSIPKILISEGIIEIDIEKAKARIKSFRIGHPTNPATLADDIQGTISGDMTLAKFWEMSNLNLKLNFSFSEGLMKSFILLDAILGAGKQANGSYGFSLTGPLSSPIPTPLAP